MLIEGDHGNLKCRIQPTDYGEMIQIDVSEHR
jgi:hypothetical protein